MIGTTTDADKINPGLFTHRGVIEQLTAGVDDGIGGKANKTWETFKTRWMFIKPMSANQILFAQKLEHRVTHKIEMYYTSGITQSMRISWNSKLFHIRGIIDVGNESRFLTLMCEEGAES